MIERVCCLCGGTDKLVDVYKAAKIKPQGKNQHAVIPKPKIYCNKCFMAKVWNR